MEFIAGNHFAFNNQLTDSRWGGLLSGSEKQFEVIRKYSIAFLETYVAGKTDLYSILEQQDRVLTGYWKEI